MAAAFGLVFCLWCMMIIFWKARTSSRTQQLQQRLDITSHGHSERQVLKLWREAQRQSRFNIETEDKATLQERLEQLRINVGWRMPVSIVFLAVIIGVIIVMTTAFLLTGEIAIAFGAAATLVAVFFGYVQQRISQRVALFERQLLDALGVSARSLRAGHPLVGAFQLVADEIDEPLSLAFAQICQEQSLGVDLKDSIQKVAKGQNNTELKLFATAISIQLQSGGNLADLMDSLAKVVRDRMRLNRRVRILTAQPRLSKWILVALPIVMFILLNVMSPEYMKPFYNTTVGKYLLGIITAGVILGIWVMNRIAVLKY